MAKDRLIYRRKKKKDLILEMTSREALPGDLIRAESRAGLVNYHRDILDSSIILTKWRRLLVRHDGLELLEVNLSITVRVSLLQHLVNVLLGERLAEGDHDRTELFPRNSAGAVAVKDLESLAQFRVGVSSRAFAGHHGEELFKVNGAAVIGIDLVKHILQLILGRVQAEGLHDCAEFHDSDLAYAVKKKTTELVETEEMAFRGWSSCHSSLQRHAHKELTS
jgi:hypothetical protein